MVVFLDPRIYNSISFFFGGVGRDGFSLPFLERGGLYFRLIILDGRFRELCDYFLMGFLDG
jgi:hypothetical protein